MYKSNCVLWARAYKIPELPFGLWTLSDKIAIINEDTASPGCAAIIKTPQGHIAYVEDVQDGIITIIEANWGSSRITRASGTEEELKILGYFNPLKPPAPSSGGDGGPVSLAKSGRDLVSLSNGEGGLASSTESNGDLASLSKGDNLVSSPDSHGDNLVSSPDSNIDPASSHDSNGGLNSSPDGNGGLDSSTVGSGDLATSTDGNGGLTQAQTATPLASELYTDMPVFSDIDDLSESELKALGVLVQLGLVQGYGDNTFQPQAIMTRAEFTYLMVSLFTPGLIARVNDGDIVPTCIFTDVPDSHWAFPYIFLATESGMVSGQGDGTFAPSSPVLYPHAARMLLSMLGYRDEANSAGGYPYGYMKLAGELRLDRGVGQGDGVNIRNENSPDDANGASVISPLDENHALCRIEAVVLLYNALDTKFNGIDTTIYSYYTHR
ncbi:MAG: S-layer homology domain-containing protein [Synergistaceae bacterium]|nr:S-layer homology domain-containing protein [Synergistaceae bacterium]